jgi:hypothetical protein
MAGGTRILFVVKWESQSFRQPHFPSLTLQTADPSLEGFDEQDCFSLHPRFVSDRSYGSDGRL